MASIKSKLTVEVIQRNQSHIKHIIVWKRNLDSIRCVIMKISLETITMKDGWLLLQKPTKKEEDKSKSGLTIPDTEEISDIQYGYLLKKGKGYVMDKKGLYEGDDKLDYMPIDIELGSQVFYMRGAGKEIIVNGDPHVLVHDDSVIMHTEIKD